MIHYEFRIQITQGFPTRSRTEGKTTRLYDPSQRPQFKSNSPFTTHTTVLDRATSKSPPPTFPLHPPPLSSTQGGVSSHSTTFQGTPRALTDAQGARVHHRVCGESRPQNESQNSRKSGQRLGGKLRKEVGGAGGMQIGTPLASCSMEHVIEISYSRA